MLEGNRSDDQYTAAASAQPIHGASNHHSSRPSDSTAHTSAMPGASRKKVMKSFFEHFYDRLAAVLAR